MQICFYCYIYYLQRSTGWAYLMTSFYWGARVLTDELIPWWIFQKDFFAVKSFIGMEFFNGSYFTGNLFMLGSMYIQYIKTKLGSGNLSERSHYNL